MVGDTTRADDEIDLAELFAVIWAKKSIVASGTIIGASAAFVYAFLLATPSFEANTRFELMEPNRPSVGELGALASLAGVDVGGGNASEADKLEDRVFSRPFLDQIAAPGGLYSDPYFNTSLQPPGLKARVFERLGLGSDEPVPQAKIDATLEARFQEAVTLNVKDNGVIDLSVAHTDAEKAAHVANAAVAQILQDLFIMRQNQSREKLEYFAEQLLDVRSDLDRTAQALKDYSLQNNLASQEELALSSSRLVSLRARREDLAQTQRALDALATVAKQHDSFETQARDAFLTQFDVAFTLEFQRLLGWTGTTNTWVLPSDAEIAKLGRELMSQYNTVVRAITRLEEEARRQAEAATELEELTREMAVHEAMYEAMIKQFESDSLSSGFAVASGRVIETASVPVEPSSPRKALIGALGLVLGVFGGTGLALVSGMRQGVLHTRSSLQDSFHLDSMVWGHKSLTKKPRRSLSNGLSSVNGKALQSVEDLLFMVSEDVPNRLAILPTSNHPLALNTVLGLGKILSYQHDRTCLVDLSGDGTLYDSVDFAHNRKGHTAEAGFDIVRPNILTHNGSRKAVLGSVEALIEGYDGVLIFCPSPDHGTSISQQVIADADAVIVVAQVGKTTRDAATLISGLTQRYTEKPTGVIIA
jgi:uncharacterized protein involved in exopolysaccharide biosynthesis